MSIPVLKIFIKAQNWNTLCGYAQGIPVFRLLRDVKLKPGF
jgi:hypothetical protein